MIRSTKSVCSITDITPHTYSTKQLPAKFIARELSEFLERYFKGVCLLKISFPERGVIDISPEGFAYVLKLIFKSATLDTPIAIDGYVNDGSIEFSLTCDCSIDDDTICKIKSSAKLCGIQFSKKGNQLFINLGKIINSANEFNSISVDVIYASLVNMFFSSPDFKDTNSNNS